MRFGWLLINSFWQPAVPNVRDYYYNSVVSLTCTFCNSIEHIRSCTTYAARIYMRRLETQSVPNVCAKASARPHEALFHCDSILPTNCSDGTQLNNE